MSERSHTLLGQICTNLRRSIVIALVVGTVLVLINHGDHIEKEPVCEHFYLKLGLCYFVPFLVSMVSGVMSAREDRTETH